MVNDFHPFHANIAFDVVGELAFGRKFGFLEEGDLLPRFD